MDSNTKLAMVAAGAGAVGFFVGMKMGAKGPSNFVERIGQAKAKAISVISPAEAKQFIQTACPTIIDVRDSGDVSNGIKGAVNIPLSNLVFMADQGFSLPADVKVKGATKIPKTHVFLHEKLAGNKDKPILVSCGLGGQALIGAGMLADYGFTNVKVVDGGNIGWLNADGEVCECMK